MATLPETDEWVSVYQLEPTDPVLGGAPNEATRAGMDNIPHLHLAKRTWWLKQRVDTLVTQVVAATTAVAGIVRLNTSTNSTSTTQAATPSAVKAVNDAVLLKADASRTVTGAGLATGGGDLTANRVITVPVATQAEAEAGLLDTSAMSPLKTAQAIIARLTGRSVLTSGLATGGGTLGADRTITVPAATQAQAEAGTDNATAATPLRVWQAIAAWATGRTISAGGLATGGGTLAADRTITVTAATQVQAENGTNSTTAMTPLGTAQAIAARLLARSVLTSGLATGGGDLSADRTISVPIATQALAEAGTDNATAMTPLRVAQRIAALVTAGTVQAGSAILTAISALAASGMIVRTGAGTVAARSIVGGTGITVTSGDGVAGNPTIDITASTQAQAEAGTNTTTVMTPVRVAQAIAALGLGGGQTWTDVTASRAVSTAYQNTTGRAIVVAVRARTGLPTPIQVSANGTSWVEVGSVVTSTAPAQSTSQTFIVPASHFYRVNGSAVIDTWSELR